jgi:hypothetical protein
MIAFAEAYSTFKKTDEFLKYCELDVKTTEGMWPKVNPWIFKGIEIKNVIFNDPATIVFWTDGTKTVVKCQDGDEFDPEKGLAMAISKKSLGNKGNYCNELKKWLPEKHVAEASLLFDIKVPDTSCLADAVKAFRNFGKTVKETNKKSAVKKAYDRLIDCRDNGVAFDIDTVIGYLGEALED